MNSGKSAENLAFESALPAVEGREHMRKFPVPTDSHRSQPLFFADNSDFKSEAQFEPFGSKSTRQHKPQETLTRFSSSKESSQYSSKRDAPSTQRPGGTLQRESDYLEKLYSGVLPNRQYLPLNGVKLPKLKTKKTKVKVAAQVASLLLPFPEAKLPKTYRAALTRTRTRQCVLHKLSAYQYVAVTSPRAS